MYDFGENIFMNNEKYLDELDGRLQVLNELRKRIIELSKAIIGDTLYKEDFFFTCWCIVWKGDILHILETSQVWVIFKGKRKIDWIQHFFVAIHKLVSVRM